MTEEQLKEKLAELGDHRIPLDADPVGAGLDAFNDKLAKLDAYNERVSEILLEALALKAAAEQKAKDLKEEYEDAKYYILATDNTVSSMRSVDLRTAAINNANMEKVTALRVAERELARTELYVRKVYHRYKDMEKKSDRLEKQMGVVNQLMRIDPNVRDTLNEQHQLKIKR